LYITQLEDTFSIETPTFLLVHKKSNVSLTIPFDMEIENNLFQLPGFLNLISSKNQKNDANLITLKVNDFDLFVNFQEKLQGFAYDLH
jgi:hypothetical protein